jgi:hypothetical protein
LYLRKRNLINKQEALRKDHPHQNTLNILVEEYAVLTGVMSAWIA